MRTQTLQEAWNDYRRHSTSMGRSPNTIKGRETSVRAFLRDYGDRKLHLVHDNHIDEYFLGASKTRSPRSMCLSHWILVGFYRYCVDTGRLKPQQNVMRYREAPKFETRDMVRIPVHKWSHLVALADQSDPRDRMLVTLGLYTLLRDQEMAPLTIGDVDLSAGTIRARITKSRTTDMVAIPADLDYELRRWYSRYQADVGPLTNDMLLLPNIAKVRGRGERGQWLMGERAYLPASPIDKCARMVTPLFEKMGYETVGADGKSTGMGAHTLRRSGARAYYDNFVTRERADALRIVQTMLHHNSAEMTQHYIGLREDRQTRDQLVRGVTIFGLHNLTQIGSVAGGDGGGEATAQIV